EDGIRDRNVTGVQTCALPICAGRRDHVSVVDVQHGGVDLDVRLAFGEKAGRMPMRDRDAAVEHAGVGDGECAQAEPGDDCSALRSEERRVGEEWRWESGSRWQ